MQFYFDLGYLKSHNNLDLEIKLLLPLKPDFSGTTYVPTSSSTRRVKSYIWGTCKARTEQLFIISMVRAYTNFHAYESEVLFKAWNIFFFALIYLFYFCFYFILLSFFWIFEWLKLFFLTQDERTGWVTYLDTLAPPKLDWNSVGLPSWLIFLCNVK